MIAALSSAPNLLAQASDGAAVASSGTAEAILFWVFAVIAIGAGIAMLALRNIVHAALMLVMNFFAISALYLGLQSSFLSIIQIIVYAGAIMVLFLFVIMLLGVDRDDHDVADALGMKVGAVVLAVAVSGAVLFAVMGTFTSDASSCGDQRPADTAVAFDEVACVGMQGALDANEQGSVGVIGERLFTRYTFAFELAAVLLTVATVGAMVLGRRREIAQDEDSAWDTDVLLPSVEDAEAILAGVGGPESVAGSEGAEEGEVSLGGADLAGGSPGFDTSATGDVPDGEASDDAPYFEGDDHADGKGVDEDGPDDSPYRDGGI